MAEINPQPLPPRVINVELPHTILNDLESFQKVQASLLGLAGCPQCTSGIEFRFRQYENFFVSPEGEISPVGAAKIGASGG